MKRLIDKALARLFTSRDGDDICALAEAVGVMQPGSPERVRQSYRDAIIDALVSDWRKEIDACTESVVSEWARRKA